MPTVNLATPKITTTESLKAGAQNVIKETNGHKLILLKRPRVKGFCVECIRKKPDPLYKKTMTKIITFCMTCPGGNWICEKCFDEKHDKMK